MTCIVRFLFVLLCLALTHTAAASVSKAAASGMGCHDTTHALISTDSRAVTPLHDAHAAHAVTQLQHQASAEHTHADCDCASKCGCLQHCATAGLMTQSSWGIVIPALPAFVSTSVAIDLPSTRISSLFRPPIFTLA